MKAYLRRSLCYEKIDEIEKAVEDMNTIVDLSKSEKGNLNLNLNLYLKRQDQLQTILNERNEKMKEEMMDKLKGFGNSILGRFGMSTDHFNMVQDPKTKSYSVNYNPPEK